MDGPDAPRPNETLRVRLEVERTLIDETPIRVSVRLPEGVTLLQGEVQESLIDGSTARIARELELQIGPAVPEGDVVVTVEQKGEGWGAHAAKAYRFGREDPASKITPLRYGTPFDLGDGKIVRPVLLD